MTLNFWYRHLVQRQILRFILPHINSRTLPFLISCLWALNPKTSSITLRAQIMEPRMNLGLLIGISELSARELLNIACADSGCSRWLLTLGLRASGSRSPDHCVRRVGIDLAVAHHGPYIRDKIISLFANEQAQSPFYNHLSTATQGKFSIAISYIIYSLKYARSDVYHS